MKTYLKLMADLEISLENIINLETRIEHKFYQLGIKIQIFGTIMTYFNVMINLETKLGNTIIYLETSLLTLNHTKLGSSILTATHRCNLGNITIKLETLR